MKDRRNFVFVAFGDYRQHPLLRLRQHDLIRGHARLALRHRPHVYVHADTAFGGHLASGAGQPRRAHVLNANHMARC